FDGATNDSFVVRGHDRFDRQTVGRGSLDRGHVLRAHQRKVQGARNRRGGKCEHIHELEELFEFLFMKNTEPLFLINDDQAEVFEYEVPGNETVGANDDIHTALAQQLQHLLLFGRRTKTAEHFDPHRIIEHALPEYFEMLLSENSSWREHGHL